MTVRRQTGQVQYGTGAREQQYENYLINGCFRVWQRGEALTSATAFPNSDDNYCADRWCLLSDGNDRADLSRETTVVPDGFNSAFKFDVETVTAAPNSEKFGILQVIEHRNCAAIIGETVHLSFYARTTSSQVENIRAAVISCDATADTVTSDVVSAWNVEGTNPTLISGAENWTYENTPSNLALTNTYQRFTIQNIAIDTAGTNNVGVFIWVDDTDLVAADVFYIAGVQLERAWPGKGVSSFVHRPIGLEKALCKRYFEKTFADGVTPQQNLGGGAGGTAGEITVTCFLEDNWDGYWIFESEKFASPTITTYCPAVASNNWYDETDASSEDETVLQTNTWGCTISGDGDGGADTTVNDTMTIHATAEAEL